MRVAQRGGNSNNGAKDGASYVNLNNTASNANWNIGAAYLIQISEDNRMRSIVLAHRQKLTRSKHLPVEQSKTDERIRQNEVL